MMDFDERLLLRIGMIAGLAAAAGADWISAQIGLPSGGFAWGIVGYCVFATAVDIWRMSR